MTEMKRRTAAQLTQQKNRFNVGDTYGNTTNNDDVANKKGPKVTVVKIVSIPPQGLSLRELASRLSMRVSDLQVKLEDLGEMISNSLSYYLSHNLFLNVFHNR